MDNQYLTALSIGAYFLGFIFAIVALWRSRTPQGTAAWVVGLISFPFVMIPAFLVFGRNRFNKYTRKLRKADKKMQDVRENLLRVYEAETKVGEMLRPFKAIADSVRQPAFTSRNSIHLLIDAPVTYQAMLEEIEKAENYILFQFYIFTSDKLGHQFKEALIKKAKQGVKVYFLYDDIGTRLKKRFVKELTAAGVKVLPFKIGKALDAKIQINFRNHRKIIVVDGATCFVGGLNIDDECLKNWRDTHVKIHGPAALAAQLSFVKDWNWASGEVLNLNWQPTLSESDSQVLVLHTGPADEAEAALLLQMTLINNAKSKLWISNPYFVPPEGLVNSLAMAAQRGVDVRVIIPSKSDNLLVDAAAKIYAEKLLLYGVKMYRFKTDFVHQKVMMVDAAFGMVGSTNFDSRSLFINFEIQAVTTDLAFIKEMDSMLTQDFTKCEELKMSYFEKQSYKGQLFSRAANLVSPML